MKLQSIQTIEVDQARFMLCQADQPQAMLIFSPALGVPADYYSTFAQTLAQQGLSVIVNELRGNGKSPVRASRRVDFGYAELINEDLRSVVNWAQQNFNDLAFLLGGHSLGGHLAFLYEAKYALGVQGLVLVASSLPYFRAYPFLLSAQILIASFIFKLATMGMGYLPGKWFGFGHREARTLIDDWIGIARTNRFNFKKDRFDYDQALSKVDCPILSICFKNDRYAPLSAVQSTVAKFDSAKLKLIHFDGDDFTSIDHFKWTQQPKTVCRKITDWLAFHKIVERFC